jgi:hypothetical protein
VLPFRHFLIHLDGSTSGLRAFSGPPGKQLADCEKLPVVVFAPISSDLPNLADLDLSTDQKYMYDMCEAVTNGVCSNELSKRDPGAMSHARWLTTANRLLRLYVSTENPSENLISLATYIVKVYCPNGLP